MADLKTRFSLEDAMSRNLENIARCGQELCASLERAGDITGRAFDNMERGAQRAATRADGAARSLGDMGGAAEHAARNNEELGRSAERAGEQAHEMGEKGADAMSMLKDALATAGIMMGLQKIAQGFMECVNAANQFEVALTKIGTIADTSRVPLTQFSDDLTALSQKTGISVGELSEAAYQAISASVDTADAVGFTATATKLATGGFTASATAVDVLTTALNAYGLQAGEASRISDMLIVTQNLGKTTVDELAQSMGRVIPIASAYGVQMDNLSTAYAELTKGGIQTAEATTYVKAILNELGKTSSEVGQVLLSQTGQSFAQLTAQGKSLGDVMEIIGDSVNGDKTAFAGLWSSVEAGIGALALYNSGAEEFNSVLGEMRGQVGATEAAYNKMTGTTEHAMREVSNSFENLKIAIGQELNPLVTALAENAVKMMDGFTEFVKENPELVRAATALGIGIGAAATAVAGFTFATKVAIPAVKSLITALMEMGTASTFAAGPLGLIVAAIAGITAAIWAYEETQKRLAHDNVMEKLTASSQKQADEIERLTQRYDDLCSAGDDMAVEAAKVKVRIDELTASYNANSQTIGELLSKTDALVEKANQANEAYTKAVSGNKTDYVGNLAIVEKFKELSELSKVMPELRGEFEALKDTIANDFPDAVSVLDPAIMGAEEYAKALSKIAENEYRVAQHEDNQKAFIDAYKNEIGLNEQKNDLLAEQSSLQKELDALQNKGFITKEEWDRERELEAALSDIGADIVDIDNSLADTLNTKEKARRGLEEYTESLEKMSDSSGRAISALQNMGSEAQKLSESYKTVYESSLEFFQGQYGLFDKAEIDTSKNAANLTAAVESQIAQGREVAAELEELTPKISQFDENMRAKLTQMAYENPQLLKDMNDMSFGERQKFVQNLRELDDIQKKQAEASAEAVTQATQKLDALLKEADDKVKKLDMGDLAQANAQNTLNGFSRGIDAAKDGAITRAQNFVDEVNRILAKAGQVDISVPGAGSAKPTAKKAGAARGTLYAPSELIVGELGPELVARPTAAYARGTLNSQDFFIAGENGPELIVGEQGSTVFPASETNRLIEAIGAAQRPLNITLPSVDSQSKSAANGNSGEKKITLEITANGMLTASDY